MQARCCWLPELVTKPDVLLGLFERFAGLSLSVNIPCLPISVVPVPIETRLGLRFFR